MVPDPGPASAAQSRPRVEGEREQQILDATLDVLSEAGYDRLTMDAVASAAKASKATLYRRWTKVSLVVDALKAAKTSHDQPADTGTLRGDLVANFCGMGSLTDPRSLAVFTSVLTAMGRDPEFADAYRRDVLGPKIAATRTIYERARERGEIPADADLDLIAPALAGVLLHRYFVLGDPPTPAVVERAIDHLILPAALAAPEKAAR